MRLGIDVGGTNTDAVLMAGRQVVAACKTPTTADVSEGIGAVLRQILASSSVDPEKIRAVMIGTTHFTNAVVEARQLAATAAVRLGAPATLAVPPMADWPDRLRRALGGHTYVCRGGNEFDGREIASLDPDELRRAASQIGEAGVTSVAITSVFSPVNAEMETEAAAILSEELPGVKISLSREIGRVGLLERENATILNASLGPLADRVLDGFEGVVAGAGVDAPLFITQNDGTLLNLDYAHRYPVATFASGPTNSMRGAAFLSGVADAVVIDIGGTTTDVGILVGGFPREASVVVHVGGVATNFRMPDVLSMGIGGGSLVRSHGEAVTVGPDSVGYRLDRRALVFGGPDLTATDIAVAGGLAAIGNRAAVEDLDREVMNGALDRIRRDIAGTVDRMKTSADPVVAIVVGGGSILLEDDLPGVSEMIRPDNFAVANAIGAAIAQVGGEVDRIYSLDDMGREEALESARSEAMERAVVAGADAATVAVVDIEEVPLPYLPSNAVRIRMKAVGDLALSV
ncbi:MAG: hydantoinase/oxoprolinase family protein [bacterium]|nr:hydantoinase/oxoprolinase family protein [Acidimicrobiia bacterium]MCY4650049.1 hydantoinase/oxoprolinase family protein [bacterium]